MSLVLAKRRQLPPPPAALRPSGLVFPAGWSPLSWVTGLEAGTRPGYAAVPASSWVWPERLQGRVGPIAHSSSRLPAAQLCPQSSAEHCPVSSGVASHTSCHDRSVAGAGDPPPAGLLGPDAGPPFACRASSDVSSAFPSNEPVLLLSLPTAIPCGSS